MDGGNAVGCMADLPAGGLSKYPRSKHADLIVAVIMRHDRRSSVEIIACCTSHLGIEAWRTRTSARTQCGLLSQGDAVVARKVGERGTVSVRHSLLI